MNARMQAFSPLLFALALAAPPTTINPMPPVVLSTTVAGWTFAEGGEGWKAQNDCTILWGAGDGRSGVLQINCTGPDPYLHRAVDVAGGRMRVRLRVKSQGSGRGSIYWATKTSPWGEDKTAHFDLIHDGQWRQYEARFEVKGDLTDLRLDPGTGPGDFQLDSLELVRETPHPITIERALPQRDKVVFELVNHRAAPVEVKARGKSIRVEASATTSVEVPLTRKTALEAVSLDVQHEGFPLLTRTVFVHHPDVPADWVTRQVGEFQLQVASDGSLARIHREGRLVAFLGPLLHRQGRLPKLVRQSGERLRFRGEGVALEIATSGQEITISLESEQPCTGPCVRVLGEIEQGLLAGLEYLGKGESSSSTLDLESEAHRRYQPDPLLLTMPLMSFSTQLATVDVSWSDRELQPLYAAPNFFDGSADNYMALRGRRIEATIRLGSAPLEESILWAVKKHGLPSLPPAPRSPAEQFQLCRQAIDGPLQGDGGWGHCAGERWGRHPFSDFASTLFRLTGQAPQLERLTPNGAHVPNDAIYFVTGRAQQWLDLKRRQVQAIQASQQADGSFRYSGKYRRGHFEDTASGICARPTATLLEYAHLTGDSSALAAGLRGLEFMKRFRTPRGAQTWEVPLHTPDQLASAYLVWAYARGYELTGNQQYLREARRWALSGVPFVYLWRRYPIMAYATPPVYGATNWKQPVWIGLPVQWVGGVYAYALLKLAPHDQTLDWRGLARGILHTAEQMQYPDGPYAGLLPDAFVLRGQQRLPARINPCALVSLRMALAGQVDSLAVAVADGRRVAAPFPVRIENHTAILSGKKGLKYQALIDGRIVDIDSQGEDRVPLPGPSPLSDS